MSVIRPKPVDMKSLRLSPEEGFVLSRVDGSTSVRELVALTGFDEGRVVDIVRRLAEEGALDAGDVGPSATAPPVSRTQQSQTGAERDADALRAEREARERKKREEEEAAAAEAEAAAAEAEAETETETEAEAEAEAEAGAEDDGEPREERSTDDDKEKKEEEQTKEEEEEEEEEEEKEARNDADYRHLYMDLYAETPRDVRLKAASEVSGAELLALCFDPDPQVIHAIFTNPTAGLNHARLVAFHHRTQMGLEAISRRADYIKDTLVQRRLLRNPQLPLTIFNKVMNPKSLLDTYKIAIDRDVPERTRNLVRETLRKKFMLAASEEKAALLWKTEGRCLAVFVQVTIDMHTTNILCNKNNYSVIFIQNLARWPATPPALLAHLLKLNVVRRSPGLAKMVLKHPNVPGEAKRNFIR
jgi:hypothetical protein